MYVKRVVFIRHGKTKGNMEKRYIGSTDEPLAQIGREEIASKKYPSADFVAVSPLKRCLESAEIIYGKDGKNFAVYADLRECDFGDFENKGFDTLQYDAKYVSWLEKGGCTDFPGGEKYSDFSKRCCDCFENIVRSISAEAAAFVVHGGTIMAILEKYAIPQKPFYDWQVKNGEYLCFELTEEKGKIRLLAAV